MISDRGLYECTKFVGYGSAVKNASLLRINIVVLNRGTGTTARLGIVPLDVEIGEAALLALSR